MKSKLLFNLFLGIHYSHFQFTIMDLLRHIEENNYSKKEYIANLYTPDSPFEKLMKSCVDAEKMIRKIELTVPEECDLKSGIENLYSPYYFLPFFAWLAINNRADIFKSDYFSYLYGKCPEAVSESLKIAVFFNANKFIKEALVFSPIEGVGAAMSIAAALGNMKILTDITNNLEKRHIPLSAIFEDNQGKNEPLFWAIRRNDIKIVELLLKIGANPHGRTFLGESLIQFAVEKNIPEIVQLLRNYGADPITKEISYSSSSEEEEEVISDKIETNDTFSFTNLINFNFFSSNREEEKEEVVVKRKWCSLI